MQIQSKQYPVQDGSTAFEALHRPARSVTVANATGAYCLMRIGANDPPRDVLTADRVIPPWSVLTVAVLATLFAFRWSSDPSGDLPPTPRSLGTASITFEDTAQAEHFAPIPTGAGREGTFYDWTHYPLASIDAATETVVFTATADVYLTYGKVMLTNVGATPANTRLQWYIDNGSGSDVTFLGYRMVYTTDNQLIPMEWYAPSVERGLLIPTGYRMVLNSLDDRLDDAMVIVQIAARD